MSQCLHVSTSEMENRSKYARFNSGLEMDIELQEDGPEPGSNSRSVGEKDSLRFLNFIFKSLHFTSGYSSVTKWNHSQNELESTCFGAAASSVCLRQDHFAWLSVL